MGNIFKYDNFNCCSNCEVNRKNDDLNFDNIKYNNEIDVCANIKNKPFTHNQKDNNLSNTFQQSKKGNKFSRVYSISDAYLLDSDYDNGNNIETYEITKAMTIKNSNKPEISIDSKEEYNKYIKNVVIIQRHIRVKLSFKKLYEYSSLLKYCISESKVNFIESSYIKNYLSHKAKEILEKIEKETNGGIHYENTSTNYPYNVVLKYQNCLPLFSFNKINKSNYYKGYVDDKIYPNLFGTLIFYDGSIYEGEFHHGVMNGKGRLIKSNGNMYICNFKNNKMDGFGEFIGYHGIKYTGEWKNNQLNGKGHEYHPDGSVYDGHFINDKKEGKGIFLWKDGSKYCGDFKNNLMDGYGEYFFSDGRHYIGYFKNNKMEGEGQLDFVNKSYYLGSFHDNKQSGFGKFVFSMNHYYEGLWKNNMKHGKGILMKEGILTEGYWEEGVLKY